MAGGGLNTGRQGASGNQQLQQWLQQFPQASAGTAAPNPQASSLSPIQAALSRLNQTGVGQSPAQQMMTGGMGMVSQPQPQPQAPMMQRPAPQLSGPPLVQSAGAQMNPQLLQLMQQRGLMG